MTLALWTLVLDRALRHLDTANTVGNNSSTTDSGILSSSEVSGYSKQCR